MLVMADGGREKAVLDSQTLRGRGQVVVIAHAGQMIQKTNITLDRTHACCDWTIEQTTEISIRFYLFINLAPDQERMLFTDVCKEICRF